MKHSISWPREDMRHSSNTTKTAKTLNAKCRNTKCNNKIIITYSILRIISRDNNKKKKWNELNKSKAVIQQLRSRRSQGRIMMKKKMIRRTQQNQKKTKNKVRKIRRRCPRKGILRKLRVRIAKKVKLMNNKISRLMIQKSNSR